MYLDALNVTHVEDVVTVVIVDSDGSLQSLGERIVQGRQNLRWVRVGQHELIAKVGVDRASLEASEDALHLHLLGLQMSRNQPRAAHAHERLQPLPRQPLDLPGRRRRRAGRPDLVGREPVPGPGPERAATRHPCGHSGSAGPVPAADAQLSAFPAAARPPEANGRGRQADRGQLAPAGPGLRRGEPGPGRESGHRPDRSDVAQRPSGAPPARRRASWCSRRSCSCS